jgi:uncharacterized membrane protein (UPF0127 family)
LAVLLLALPLSAPRAADSELEVVPLAIESPSGRERHEFQVEVARTPAEQAQGLMHRAELAPDRGMLFVHRRAKVANFWMKNTLIPLDMIWIGRDGRVVGVHENAVPNSTDVISSNLPVTAILEVPGGTAERLGIGPGHRVESSALD